MRRISLRGAQVLAAAFPKCGIEMRNQMRRDASTLNLPSEHHESDEHGTTFNQCGYDAVNWRRMYSTMILTNLRSINSVRFTHPDLTCLRNL